MEEIGLVNKFILSFRDILLSSWNVINDLDQEDNTGSFLIDWQQAIWERIVEHSLFSKYGQLFLEVYGEGADLNGDSSRISFADKTPTHVVGCRAKSKFIKDVLTNKQFSIGEGELLRFEKFVSIKDGWYYDTCPLDHVMLTRDSNELVVNLREIDFILFKYTD